VILLVLLALSALVVWQFAGYPLAMGWLALRTPARVPESDGGTEEPPFVSVIVPTYEEAGVVGDRIANLAAQTHPRDRFEVLVVDSGSTDGTAEAAEAAADAHPELTVRVVRQAAREGKASAVNAGMDAAAGEVVLVTDANTEYVPEVIERVARQFTDPTVGAVAGRHRLPQTDNTFTSSNQFHRDLEHMKALGESRIDSAAQFGGELSAWRKSLARADPESLAEDLDLSVRIRKQGYRIAYEPTAVAYESEPDNLGEQIQSNKRRTIGAIQTMRRHWRWLAVPGDAYRALVFPSRKGLPTVSPFLLGGILVGYLLSRDPRVIATHLVVSGGASAAVLAALLRVKADLLEDGGDDGSESLSPGDFVGLAYYVLVAEYFVLAAWWDYLAGEYSVLWAKSTSDRAAGGGGDAPE
jgi:cellulose synthase/poly-beta-1,6-N-acetylglucosamine synthase-like glycosyltransferase